MQSTSRLVHLPFLDENQKKEMFTEMFCSPLYFRNIKKRTKKLFHQKLCLSDLCCYYAVD